MTETTSTQTTAIDLRKAFGLRMIPFTREVVIPWESEIFTEAISDLQRVIENRMSGALIAPAGTGKTSVLRALTRELPEARYHVTYIKVTSLSKRDFCRELATAIGLDPVGTYPKLVRTLQDSVQNATDTDALDAVYEVSRGNLRAIDHIARKSLEIAAKKHVPTVDAAIVMAARKQLLP